jgi:predicted PurR-regulated permease PerM
MSEPLRIGGEGPTPIEPDRWGTAARKRQRAPGWRNADVLRTAALVIGLYVVLRVFWVANPLFFTAFLGILFGLAVASGVDRLQRFGIGRGIGAALIVLAFLGLLFGFGALMTPTIRMQSTELQHQLPDAIARAEAWARAHQNGAVGMVIGGVFDGDSLTVHPTAQSLQHILDRKSVV